MGTAVVLIGDTTQEHKEFCVLHRIRPLSVPDCINYGAHWLCEDGTHLHFRNVNPNFLYVFSAFSQRNIFLLWVGERLVDLLEGNLIFLENLVHFYVVAMESAEVLTVYFFWIGVNVIVQQFVNGLWYCLTNFWLTVKLGCDTSDYLQKFVPIQITFGTRDKSVQGDIGCNQDAI